ncbi:hypothetical protein [Herbaspirillum huttiense]|uniref:hypothetical protein n=1 Tax=Herbaspirillum huttiense TaxID=863372 RepID=UPI003B3AA495
MLKIPMTENASLKIPAVVARSLVVPLTLSRQRREPRRGRKTIQLRGYIKAARHLRDPSKGLSEPNLKFLREIAEDNGIASTSMVSHFLKREFPEVAAVMSLRDTRKPRAAIKAAALDLLIAEGGHLLDKSRELETSNLKTQVELARILRMDQKGVSNHLRQEHPAIATLMTPRRKAYQNERP